MAHGECLSDIHVVPLCAFIAPVRNFILSNPIIIFPIASRVYSFPVFTDQFCKRFLEELENFEKSDVPKGRPNTMNNTGVCHNNACTCVFHHNARV